MGAELHPLRALLAVVEHGNFAGDGPPPVERRTYALAMHQTPAGSATARG
jgi:hypothetical protein